MLMLGQDLRYGLRLLRKRPGFTAAVAVTLALGIGGTTAVFSVFHAVLLRPLPFGEPDRLVLVRDAYASEGGELQNVQVNGRNLDALQRQARCFDGLAALGDHSFSLGGDA